ncbi:MAG: wax ester/triacylglycerol synthase domain-containing protein [Mycobacterium sp.]|jgi:diacylglycerol O-acyltransferase|uniref:wax ester/triacylglycerol synthase domain-containing protein n=1 Tax=Mycobacterium sp. TaxID=1785 RepID=UPI00389AB6A2
MWREDADIDFGYHVRRIEVAAAGGRRELDEVIGQIASTPLDRSHPHHALADGVASANLMARAMEWPDVIQDEGEPTVARTPPSAVELIRAAGRDHVRKLTKLPNVLWDSVIGVYRLQRRARERRKNPDLARQFNPPLTFLNHKLSSARTFASASLSLAEAKETSKTPGKADPRAQGSLLVCAIGNYKNSSSPLLMATRRPRHSLGAPGKTEAAQG